VSHLEVDTGVEVHQCLYPGLSLCLLLGEYGLSERGAGLGVHVEGADLLAIHVVPERQAVLASRLHGADKPSLEVGALG